MSIKKATIERNILGQFPSKACSFGHDIPSNHYCVAIDSTGTEIFTSCGDPTTLEKRCGKVFCVQCKTEANYESTTLCPLHYQASKKPKSINQESNALSQTANSTDPTANSTDPTPNSTDLTPNSTDPTPNSSTKINRNDPMLDKSSSPRKRRSNALGSMSGKRIKINGRVGVKRSTIYHALNNKKELQQYISSDHGNDYYYFGTVKEKLGSSKMYRVAMDVLPNPDNNDVVLNRNNLQVVNEEVETVLSETNRNVLEDVQTKITKLSSKEKCIEAFMGKGADFMKKATEFKMIETIDNHDYTLDWKILKPGENISEDTFIFPSEPELDLDDENLSEPGTN